MLPGGINVQLPAVLQATSNLLSAVTCGGSEKEEEKNSLVQEPVYCNVYDLTPYNQVLFWVGFGIFHTGIEGERRIQSGTK